MMNITYSRRPRVHGRTTWHKQDPPTNGHYRSMTPTQPREHMQIHKYWICSSISCPWWQSTINAIRRIPSPKYPSANTNNFLFHPAPLYCYIFQYDLPLFGWVYTQYIIRNQRHNNRCSYYLTQQQSLFKSQSVVIFKFHSIDSNSIEGLCRR